jgi:hypothetical protein
MDYKAKAHELQIALNELYTFSDYGRGILRQRKAMQESISRISRLGFTVDDLRGFKLTTIDK